MWYLFFFCCRTIFIQESSMVFGFLLLGFRCRFALSCLHFGLCPGRLLHGLCVNIHCQLCIALHQLQTQEGDWRDERKSWIESVNCEIQHHIFLLSWSSWKKWNAKQLLECLWTIYTSSEKKSWRCPEELDRIIFFQKKLEWLFCISVHLWCWLHPLEHYLLSCVIFKFAIML